MSELTKLDQAYVAHTYNRFPVEIASGKGSTVYSPDGKRYIDMGSGIGVTAFGIADDAWQQAVITQLGRVQHMSNLYYTEPCAKLAQMLCERTGMKKVFFGNSGAEANECAIKVARKYAAEKKGAEYHTIVTLESSFHGRTLTTLAATGQDHFHQLFQPLTPGFAHAPANDLDACIRVAEETKAAAFLIECVQGEGGVKVLDKAFVQGLAAWAKAHDVLLMVDEVQTGNGRTGALYAYMHYGIQPDVISTAKGLGGGLPLGAALLGEKVENVLSYGDHGSTFGGNPVCCAGAISVIERLDEAFLKQVQEKGAWVFEQLTGAPGVEAVTGMGLMVGIKTVKPAAEVLKTCMENGVLCLTAKEKVRLLPALNISWEELKEAVAVIKAACAESGGTSMSLKNRHFLTLLDFTPEEINELLDLSADLKAKKKAGIPHRLCEGKNIALVFEKTSTRTRCAFEVAAADLGMTSVYLDPSASQIGKKESIADTAQVLGRMFDGIEYRGFGQERVEALAQYAGVPVWNGLTNEYHPTQILADMLTIREHFGSLKGKKLVYMGDARYNMGNSLMIGCAKLGMQFVACAPKKYFPSAELIAQCEAVAAQTGATLTFETDPAKAVENADVIYTDVWVSMGEPDSVWEERIRELTPYRVTMQLMQLAGAQCRFMHCLPAFHDLNTTIGQQMYEKFGLTCMEVTDEVFQSPQSIVFDEAENRMHTIKAVMAATLV